MQFPPCLYRTATDRFPALSRCENPQVFSPSNLVTAAICESCQLRVSPSPEAGRGTLGLPSEKSRDGSRGTLWATRPFSVSVIITCHDYGQFLEDCLQSVLTQTHPPAEIIIIDDASQDSTAAAAARYSDQVHYIRCEFHNVHRARQAGVEATTSNVLLFLDADNCLPPDYVERGLEEFDDPRVGFVYPDLQEFGDRNRRITWPEWDRNAFVRDNFVDASSLIRRDVFLQADPLKPPLEDMDTWEDYLMFRRIVALGFEGRKQRCPLWYRVHRGSMSHRRSARARSYFVSRGLSYESVTLFIPLSGRQSCWSRQKEWLDRQQWPHDQIRLILCDSSGDARFHHELRRWSAESDYPDVRVMRDDVGPSGLADQDRRKRETEDHVQIVMCRIYNRLRAAVETPYTWIVEDDVIPPVDALNCLLHHFAPDVGTVGGVYRSRYDPAYVVWDPEGHRVVPPATGKSSVIDVGGCGFGCLVVRSELLKNHVFCVPPGERWYDPVFFKFMGPWRRLVDFSVECEHLSPTMFAAASPTVV